MKDTTKQILAVLISSFIIGMFSGIFSGRLSPEIFMLIFVILLIIMFLVVKKFTPKSFKNDELMKKLAIMNDAVAGRTALVMMLIIFMMEFYFHSSITEFFGLDDFYLIGFIFFAMGIAGIISHIYYSHNPDKLP